MFLQLLAVKFSAYFIPLNSVITQKQSYNKHTFPHIIHNIKIEHTVQYDQTCDITEDLGILYFTQKYAEHHI